MALFQRKSGRRKLLLWLVLLAVMIAVAFFLVSGLQTQADTEGLRLAQEQVRRAAVQCYALEGFYPPDLDYLKERYGVELDEEKYAVHYIYIASNLMPDITVLPVQQ